MFARRSVCCDAGECVRDRSTFVRVCACVGVVVCVAWLLWRPGCHGCERWTVGRGVWPGVCGRRQWVSGSAGGVECGRQQRAAAHRLCVGGRGCGCGRMRWAGVRGGVGGRDVWAAGAVWSACGGRAVCGCEECEEPAVWCVVGMLVGMVCCVMGGMSCDGG